MFKLRSLPKPLFAGLLMMLSVSQPAAAEIKLYQYDGKLPFAQMMLNMMVAMGVLDRIPTHGPYAGYGLNSYPGSALSNYRNPYARALALRGFNPGSSYLGNLYGNNYNLNNPFIRSPWLQSPWSTSAFGSSPYSSPLWNNPNWGVLPYDSTSPYDAVNGVVDGAMWDAPIWSQSELDGWVNEPWSDDTWETSSWNPDANTNRSQGRPQSAVNQTAPLIQNFNYGTPPDARQGTQAGRKEGRQEGRQDSNRSSNRSPLSKLAPPEYQSPPRQTARSSQKPSRPSPLHKRMGQDYADGYATPPKKKSSEKRYPGPACVTEFCGLMKPDMDGLWVAQNGEMLGIKDDRYLWSDGQSRYLTGHMKIQNEYLLANVDGHDQLMRFKYKLAGNHLMTLRPNGTITEFARIPVSQLSADDFYSIPSGPDMYGPNVYGPDMYNPDMPGRQMSGGPYDRSYDAPANIPYGAPYGGLYSGQYDLPYGEGGNNPGDNPGNSLGNVSGQTTNKAPNMSPNKAINKQPNQLR